MEGVNNNKDEWNVRRYFYHNPTPEKIEELNLQYDDYLGEYYRDVLFKDSDNFDEENEIE